MQGIASAPWLTVVYGNPQVDDQRCESAEGRGSYKNIRQRCRWNAVPFC